MVELAGGVTIGRLAEAAGVNVETVRYYERRGLLEQPDRPAGAYRRYSTADLWRLQFIRRGKDLGFSLAEIADLLGDDGERSAGAVLEAAQAKLAAIDERRQELDDLRVRLEQLAAMCERGDDPDCVALRVT
jgi:MerR family mercuric resistance operon transcriptional regulator